MLKYLYLLLMHVKGATKSTLCLVKRLLLLAIVRHAECPAQCLSNPISEQKHNVEGTETKTNSSAICHIICQAMIAVIILQSCKLILINHNQVEQIVKWHLVNLLIHLCVFWWVLHLSKRGQFLWARTLLIVGFCSYVTVACVIWEFNVNVQYYFLLAFFISIYLINSNEKIWLTLCLSFQLISFIGFSFTLPILATPQYELLAIAQTNSIIFAVSCCICALFIRTILSRNWHLMRSYETQQKQLINQVFPNHLGTELINHNMRAQQGDLSQHKHMAVLFLDICDFTQGILPASNSWQKTYALFARFDALIKHLDTKRIKTNGDQYIVVVGLLSKHLSNKEIAEQALTASVLIANHCTHTASVQVRQGLAFGDIVYGIFDTNSPVFDVWGETVVTAARLEAIAQASSIVVNKSLYLMTQDKFHYHPCVKADLKGFGTTETYTVSL